MKPPVLILMTALLGIDIVFCQKDTGCPSSPICDATATGCLGYGDLSIKCGNGTKISFGNCYMASICDSVAANQGNDWIRVTASNINPKQCFAYSGQIKQNLLTAYNTWCCQGDNYMKCCPGSTGWPSGVPKSGINCQAMQNYTNEIAYQGACGSQSQTTFLMQLRPGSDSPMCQLVLYSGNSGNSTAATTSTTTTAAAATTTTASSNVSSTAATGRRRKRRNSGDNDLAMISYETILDDSLVNDEAAVAANSAILLRRRVRGAAATITLDQQTVGLLITGIDVSGLVASVIATASNYTLIVTVTVQQNVAPASTLSPDRRSDSWTIATGVICGLVAVLLLVYLTACIVHRSRKKGDGLPL